MPENQTFLPKTHLLNYQEISDIAARFIAHGIRKIRLTGGEPLVRRDIDHLITSLGQHIHNGDLEELTLTTNGSRLSEYAQTLAQAGVKRINVSMDSMDAHKFNSITRGGDIAQVLSGIEAAQRHNIAVRINMVALKGQNEDDLIQMAQYCAENGHDLALIETMPLGNNIDDREDSYISLDDFIAPLKFNNQFSPLSHRTSGPARYWQVEPLGLRLGLITPMSKNFCSDCNRLRLTTDGKIYMCLGSSMHVDFKTAIREHGINAVDALLQKALRLKPERHDFEKQMQEPMVRLQRHMNATGG